MLSNATRDYSRQSQYPGADHMDTEQARQVSRHIRGNQQSYPESGMNGGGGGQSSMPGMDMGGGMMGMEQGPPPQIDVVVPMRDSPSCLEVADHVQHCPICSKLYATDKTIYLIAIVILAVICIVLLKKILDV